MFKGQNYLLLYDTFSVLLLGQKERSVSEVTLEFLELMRKFSARAGSVYAVCCSSKAVAKFCPSESTQPDSHVLELAQV